MQKILQLLSIYIIVIGVIFSLFISINSRANDQLSLTKSELAGVSYLKKLYTLSSNLALYIESIETQQGKETENFFKTELHKNIKDIYLSLDSFPQFLNDEIVHKLNAIENFELKTEEYYDILDFLNHENYVAGDVSKLLFEEDRMLYFLSSLTTHYMPEYLISILVVHNKVEVFKVKGDLSSASKTLYTEQNKLLYLSTEEISGIVGLLAPYQESQKLSTLLLQTTHVLEQLQSYTRTFEEWEKDKEALNAYIAESYKLLGLAQELYNENFVLLESSLQKRETDLNRKILYNRLSFVVLLILISLVTFYYYRSLVSNQKKDDEIQKINDTLDKMVIYSRTDPHGNITHVSEALEELNQYKKEEIIGKTHRVFRHPDMPNELFEGMWKTILNHKEWKGEIKNRKKDGTSYWVKMQITPDLDEKGKLLGFNAYREEISDKKHLEEEKHKTLKALEFKSMFLSNMSHEIRTPLNGIIGFTYMALKTDLSERQADLLQKINSTAGILLHVINDILDISKIEAGKMQIEKTEFNLRETAQEVIELLQSDADKQGISLNVFFEDIKGFHFLGDSLRISQVLTNLLNNAIKFTHEGSVTLRIKQLPSHAIHFEIKDTGIGLKEEEISSLFQNFSQADMSTSRKFGGTGLGLSICKNLIELMDGTISLSSTFGVGSTFTFQLPLQMIAPSIKVDSVDINTQAINEAEVNALDEVNILVAEDNKMNQVLLTMLLEESQIRLDFAEDGKIAIDKFKENDYDMILMDIQMPDVNGYEATMAIRELDTAIPIIALSANVMEEDIQKAYDSGMNDYLAKPIEVEKLHIALLKYLKGQSQPH